MYRRTLAAISAASLVVLTGAVATHAAGVAASAQGAPGRQVAPASLSAHRDRSDNLSTPLLSKQNALRQAGLEQQLRGGVAAKKGVVALGGKQHRQYAKLAQTGKDRIFVILAEFGKTVHPSYPNGDSNATKFVGPLHNKIPKPDRTVNNSTLWQRNYSRAHYRNMYFKRMNAYYRSQSAGKYSINGDVTAWVKVPFNEARYGRNDCGDIICSNTWFLIRDAMAYWVKSRLAAGESMQQIRTYLKTFDKQDRYDFDGDGDFREPDGYIDHLQIVHAGGDEASADPIYGTDAIWSHRWQAAVNPSGTGPSGLAQDGGVNLGEGGLSGGVVQIPNHPTGVWALDYTIQPENGGLGVFAHEFGHDLGLPDLYDTSGNTGGAENSTGFWTLMSSGSHLGDRGADGGIDDAPPDLGTWEKFQLGWLKYDVSRAGRISRHLIGPSARKTKNPDAVIVLLPNKKVPLELGAPCATCGEQYYYSDSGDDLSNTMTRAVVGGGPLAATVRYDIEEDFDYAFVDASSDGGATWTPIRTNLSSLTGDQSGLNPTGAGITGSTAGAWVNLTATLPANTDTVRFRYSTDAAYALQGFEVDNVTVGGVDIGTAEAGAEGWVFDGFRTTTGSELLSYLNAYFAENRQYTGYDASLRNPYNFGFSPKRPSWVEYFPYQNGLLINYWDTSYSDNNVGDHPGGGLILPVDAHPFFAHAYDGSLLRPRILSYDSTFGRQPTDRIALHIEGRKVVIGSHKAIPRFNDLLDYWYDFDEHGSTGQHPGRYQPGWYSVDVPKTGTTIRVLKGGKHGALKIRVGRA